MASSPVNRFRSSNHSYGIPPYARGVTKGKQTGRPGLSEAEATRLRELVERLLEEKFDGNRTAFARAIGRSQPAVTQLLGGTNKASLETLKRVAAVAGIPYMSLLDEGQGERGTTTHYDSEEAWRARARAEGFDPDDPEVAEVYRTAFKDAETTIGFAAAELRRRQAERKGKTLGVREVDEEDEGLGKARKRKG